MTDKKLTDSEIVKACKDCLHYEACKGTYSSAKGDEDILYDFDGEMYANSGCEDFKDKDLINRLQAENERLFADNQKYLSVMLWGNKKNVKNLLNQIKAEAYKECIKKVNNKIRFLENRGFSIHYVVKDALNNLLKELVGEDNASKD